MHIQTVRLSAALTAGVTVGNACELSLNIKVVISEIMDIIPKIVTSSYVGNMIGLIVQSK